MIIILAITFAIYIMIQNEMIYTCWNLFTCIIKNKPSWPQTKSKNRKLLVYCLWVVLARFLTISGFTKGTCPFSDRAERYDFWPRLWLFCSSFLFSPKKKSEEKKENGSKNRDQQSCLSARSPLAGKVDLNR